MTRNLTRKIRYLLLFFSGASTKILLRDECITERNKYASIGVNNFLVSILESLSIGYIVFIVSSSIILSTGIGIFSGIFTLNINRLLTGNTRRRKKKLERLSVVFFHIIIASVLGSIVAKTVELMIFEQEIKVQIKKNRFAETEKNLKQLELRDKSSIDQKQSRISNLENLFRKEIEVTGGSGLKVPGSEIKKYQSEIDELQKQIKALEYNRREIAEGFTINIDNESHSSFPEKISALEELARIDPLVAKTGIFIYLVFLGVNLSPILIASLSPFGPYESIINGEINTKLPVKDTHNRDEIEFYSEIAKIDILSEYKQVELTRLVLENYQLALQDVKRKHSLELQAKQREIEAYRMYSDDLKETYEGLLEPRELDQRNAE